MGSDQINHSGQKRYYPYSAEYGEHTEISSDFHLVLEYFRDIIIIGAFDIIPQIRKIHGVAFLIPTISTRKRQPVKNLFMFETQIVLKL
jgi:hypothetical protein